MKFKVERFVSQYHDQVVELSLRAWAPVFLHLRDYVPSYVYNAFYPNGWESRQKADISAFLATAGDLAFVAIDGTNPVGWIGLRIHPEDKMGEIYILAVDPDRQREKIATLLIEAGFTYMRAAGMKMAMVETGDDPGHAASRATYEHIGFERWPVARYFREF